MAASLVTTGAIDADAFRAAHGESFATFSKIQPFLAELRAASGELDFCKHMETVVSGTPGAEAMLVSATERSHPCGCKTRLRDRQSQAVILEARP